MPTDLLLIRHGETDWNRARRLQGHRDIALNEEGLRQAERLGKALAGESLQAVFSSDLQRARQTAQAVARHHGLAVMEDARLRERCYGICEGLTYGEIADHHPRHYAAWQAREPDFVPQDGESLRYFSERVAQTVVELATLHVGTIAIIVHGGVLDALYRAARDMPIQAPRNFDLPNAGINRLRCEGDRLHLVKWADTSHLEQTALDEVDKRIP